VPQRNPADVETAIRVALDDPRVSVAVIQTPDGNLAARLTGSVRNAAEAEAARTITALYVPQVISSIYVDPEASTLQAAAALPTDRQLQGNCAS
jgi:hypothetical protein